MGRILEEDIAAVRERADIVQVIGEHVSLKQRGRVFWGICPFHEEKSPSFKVDQQSQLYHCFGCGTGGNVFSFLMALEKMDFPEAVEAVASRVGIEIRRESTGGAGGQASTDNTRARLRNANDLAQRFFEAMLSHESYGASARKYLSDRGYTPEVASTFHLGYAPAQDQALYAALTKRGIAPADLETAGLVRSNPGHRSRDMFRGRLIFPIFDLQGRPIAFGGRIIGDGNPKYLNTPETPLFQKGAVLYGLAAAREGISAQQAVIVVEGYTDVISLHANGINNVVGTLGTALTTDHIRLLKRFCDRIVLVFDGDRAGAAASERVLELGDEALSMSVVSLPEGSDPADAVASHGPEWFVSQVQSGVPLLEYAIGRLVSRHGGSGRNERLTAAKKAIAVLAAPAKDGRRLRIDIDGVVGSECVKILAEKLFLEEAAIRHELALLRRDKLASQGSSASLGGKRRNRNVPLTVSGSPETVAERELLKVMLRWDQAGILAKNVELDDFSVDVHRGLAGILIERGLGAPVSGFVHDLSTDHRQLVSALMLDFFPADNIKKYVSDVLTKVKDCALERKIGALKQKLEKMNPLKEGNSYNDLFGELIELEAARRDLKSRDLLEAGK